MRMGAEEAGHRSGPLHLPLALGTHSIFPHPPLLLSSPPPWSQATHLSTLAHMVAASGTHTQQTP